MKYNKLYLTPILILLLIACGGKSESSDKEVESESTSEKVEASNSSCVLSIIEGNEVAQLLSKDKMLTLIQVSDSVLEQHISKSSKGKFVSLDYKWEPEEERVMVSEMKIGDRTITNKIPVKNTVGIGSIKLLAPEDMTALTYFERAYGPKTDEEKEQAKKRIDASKESSDKVDKKAAKMLKGMLDKQKVFIVDELGDRAYWSEMSINGVKFVELWVLDTDVMFKLTVDVSAETPKDLELAKKIANTILSNCE